MDYPQYPAVVGFWPTLECDTNPAAAGLEAQRTSAHQLTRDLRLRRALAASGCQYLVLPTRSSYYPRVGTGRGGAPKNQAALRYIDS